MYILASIVISLVAGYVCQRIFNLPGSVIQRLNQLVIFVILPAVILLKVPTMEKSGAHIWFPVISCWIVVAISAALVMVCSKAFNWSRKMTGTMLMVAPLGNTSYLGFPAIQLLLGDDDALSYAILYDQLGNFIALAVYGSLVISLYGTFKPPKITAKTLAAQVFKFPPFIALLVALNIDGLSDGLTWVLEQPAKILAPVTMFIVGMQFKPRIEASLRVPITIGLLIKMVVGPIVLITAGLITAQPVDMLESLTLEAAMPPMVTAGIMAMAVGLDEKLSASMIGLGVILSAITLPLITYLMRLYL